jgi:hypothetical protein
MFSRKVFFVLAILLLSSALLALGHSKKLTGVEDQAIKFTGKEDHAITLEEASKLTSNFRNQAGPDQIHGGFFGREAVLSILEQEGSVGIRYYYGLDDDGTPRIVLVGVDEDGNDMTKGLLAERAFACPPLCSEANELNSSMSKIEISGNF